MRIDWTLLATAALVSGCAQAQRLPPIGDTEPDVTQQIAVVLTQLRNNAVPREQLTDKAHAALSAPLLRQMGVALQPCATPPALELLSRTTKGEDRNYLYRALCGNTTLLVEINFNKAARIDRLVVRSEPKE